MFILVSFILTFVLLLWLKKVAVKVGLVDKPGGRKKHKNTVPLVGGIAIFTAFTLLSFTATPWWEHKMSFIALSILLYMGVIDDIKEISAKFKFVVHFIVASMLVADGTVLISMGDILGFGETSFGWFAPVFTVLCIVYLINAINMIDGVDGLSGGIGLIVGIFLLSASLMKGVPVSAELRFLIGALLAFLIFNYRHPWRERASVFMGDAGTMCLGFVLAWLAIDLSQDTSSLYGAVLEPISIAWLLALPIWDAFGMLTARARHGKNPFEPDRNHFHHHFLEAGFNQSQTTALILLYCIALCSFGVFAPSWGMPIWALTYIWIVMWLAHAQLSYRPEKFICLLKCLRQIGQKRQKSDS